MHARCSTSSRTRSIATRRHSRIDAVDAILTYAELSSAADRVAARLREAGVGPGARVGVRLASGSSTLYVGILGVLRAGAAYVPVDADDPPARAATIWESAEVCGVLQELLQFTRRRPVAGLAAAAGLRSTRRMAPAANGRVSVRDECPSAEDDAWIIFTSGSTGAPKGVAVSHRAAAAFVDAEARLWTRRPRGPRARGAVGLVRRELRGDLAGVGQRRRARAGPARAGPRRRRPRPLAGRARRQRDLDRSDARRDVARRCSRACAC